MTRSYFYPIINRERLSHPISPIVVRRLGNRYADLASTPFRAVFPTAEAER